MHWYRSAYNQRGRIRYSGQHRWNVLYSGRKQLFGYVSYIYALKGAYELTGNEFYDKLAYKTFKYINQFKETDIVFEDGKLHPYNNKGDYLAFASVYLFMASDIPNQTPSYEHSIMYSISKIIYRSSSLLYKLVFKPKDFILTLKYFKDKMNYYDKKGGLIEKWK